jgi:hypothetical protein
VCWYVGMNSLWFSCLIVWLVDEMMMLIVPSLRTVCLIYASGFGTQTSLGPLGVSVCSEDNWLLHYSDCTYHSPKPSTG